MITLDEAETIAEYKIPSHHSIVKTIEKPYGWYFFSQTKQYVETGDFRDMEVGSGGFLVEKENGRIVEFGSAHSLEENLKIYEAGLAYGKCNLTILNVNDFRLAVRVLKNLNLTDTKEKIENGIRWKMPKLLNEKEINIRLQKLPFTFKDQNFYFRYEEFETMKKSGCLEYDLKPKT